ncbi:MULTISPECIES: serpin family protein [unclassified Spirosoma]|uniref:serpin family protein n=1 Tax=unclassified Spirosoma TaxID=2621999 RepID=UPI0009644BBF|nr:MULTISPECIES: serpin family protein [unclassified Spirosoma]MBN8823983.1 serpin family protein [Spirosoma sp.]OJW70394.1 MAG: proteinase inhibitor I4 serpin [Spirosoma sp. 48-14]
MKPTLFSTLATITIGVLLTTIGCKNSNLSPDTSTASELRVSAPFASQTTQFAFDVTKEVVAEEGQAKNVFISPLSLHIALGMILNGANGQTAQEIQKTLKLDTQTLADANKTYQNLMENLPGVDSKVTLGLANSVWYRNTFAVENSFQDLLKQSFQAEVSAQDFNDPATLGKINGWASQKTNGKIPKVLDQIQPDNVMFLMNALYFKGDWKKQFDASKTVDIPFKLATGGTTNVRMMRLNTELNRASRSNYTAFELPYGSDKFAMTVLLPSENSSADALVNSLNSEEWAQLQKAMAPGTIDIGLPKFTMQYEVKLNKTLSTLGMSTAFTDAADFTKINAKGGLTLSFVKQNTFVAVDEKGTEAAAVTTGGISVTSAPLPVLCDRPFLFVIHEKTSGTILFVGKIADPTKTNS